MMIFFNPTHDLLNTPLAKEGILRTIQQRRLGQTAKHVRGFYGSARDSHGHLLYHKNIRIFQRLRGCNIRESLLHAALLYNVLGNGYSQEELYKVGYPISTTSVLDELFWNPLRLDRGDTFGKWSVWFLDYASAGAKMIMYAICEDEISWCKYYGYNYGYSWEVLKEKLESNIPSLLTKIVKGYSGPASIGARR